MAEYNFDHAQIDHCKNVYMVQKPQNRGECN